MPDRENGGKGVVSVQMLRPTTELAALVDADYIVETFGLMQDRHLARPGNFHFRTSGNWVLMIDGTIYSTGKCSALFGPTDRTGRGARAAPNPSSLIRNTAMKGRALPQSGC